MKRQKIVAIMIMGVLAAGFVGEKNVSAYSTDFIMSITPAVALSVPTNVALELAATGEGVFGNKDFNVLASTNSEAGYRLTMTTEKTYLEANVVDPSTSENAKINAIPFVSGGITQAAFSASTDMNVLNHWGVSIDNTTSYNPIKLSDLIKETYTEATQDPTTINVGMKLNSGVLPGTYTTRMNFQLVAKIVEPVVKPEYLCTDNECSEDKDDPTKDSTHTDGQDNSVTYGGGTLARAYEVYYTNTLHKGMYVPIRDTTTGNFTGEYKVATSGNDYDGIAASNYRFAMQDMASEICNNTTVIPDHLQVLDTRDNKTYWISKLADGKCWMTQNLDLDLDNRTALTSADSDVINDWVPAQSTQKGDSVTHWDYSYTNAQSFDPGDWYWNNTPWYESVTNNFIMGDYGHDPVRFARVPFEGNGTHGHVGNYYSWSAAVAMNDTSSYVAYGYNSGADINQMPQTSICPKGWRLPYAMNKSDNKPNDFQDILDVYYPTNYEQHTDYEQVSAPIYYVRAGYVNDYTSQRFNYSGSYGSYWSNTTTGNQSAFTNEFNSTSWYTYAISNYRYKGMNVRCIAR